MPSNYFSRLRGSFRQGIQRSYVVLEDSFVDSLGVLPVQGKLLYNKPGFYYRTFAAFSDLNILFQRGNPVAAQSNLKSTSQGKNLSVVGAVSRTLSIPSVSGPPFQVCGYHIDNLLTGHHKLPRALTGSNALLGRYYPNKSTVSRGHLYSSNGNSREFHNGWQISTSLRNKVQPDSYFLHGYSKTSVCIGSECENLHTTSATCLSASTASDMSFDHSVCDDQHASSIDSKDRMAPEGRSLKLLSGSCSLPHPEKEETGVQDEPTGYTDPARVLEIAHANTKAKGSSTACIIALTDQGLRAFNLGDSGFMVIRDGYTVFRSPAQQHTFNYTYQLANGGIGDSPSAGQVFSISVAPGDVIVAGTDGLFDNLYNNDITAVVVHAVRAGFGPQVMAQKIAALARQRAQDKDRQTPFSAAAQEAGFRYYGGKLDDITVVVSYITTSKYDESIPSSLA
uniref:probable protein phosphatase 2C 55 isoform X2 n=1 Tax=Erigeron canadensis TaxID=72917 RepID=UPI001CB96259|nr:probable protein phosphatase 2C 55 isoform X2 [Erigeron canadensis]